MERQTAGTLAEAARSGDQAAFGQLYDDWFDRVHDLAARIVGDRAAADDVAQDTFLTAWRRLDSLENPDAFGGWLLRIARNTALNARRDAQRARPVDDETMAVIETGAPAAGAPAGFGVEDRARTVADPARAAADAELAGLVWESAAALPERDVTVLDLNLRYGLLPAEIGAVIGINRNAANQLLHRVRERLADAIRARVLWRGGAPQCEALAEALAAAGVTRFGADAVQVASAHAEDCTECSERRKTRLAPATLFGAVPFAVTPALVKQHVAGGLAEAGVPMQGSAYGPGAVARGAARSRGARRVLVAAGSGAAILLAVLGVVLAQGGDDGTDEVVTVDTEARLRLTTTTTTTSTTSASPTTTTTTAPTDAGGALPGPAPPDGPADPGSTPTPIEPGPADPGLAPGGGGAPPPSPPAASASISISPASRVANYPNDATAPVLSWSSANAASVSVSGPGVSSTAASGSLRVCPTSAAAWSFCAAGPGSYTYVVTARDDNGDVVAQEFATLTLT